MLFCTSDNIRYASINRVQKGNQFHWCDVRQNKNINSFCHPAHCCMLICSGLSHHCFANVPVCVSVVHDQHRPHLQPLEKLWDSLLCERSAGLLWRHGLACQHQWCKRVVRRIVAFCCRMCYFFKNILASRIYTHLIYNISCIFLPNPELFWLSWYSPMVVLAAVWCLPSASVSWCTDALGLFSSKLHPNSNFELFLLTGDRLLLHLNYNFCLLGSSYCCSYNSLNAFFCQRNTLALGWKVFVFRKVITKVIQSKAVRNWAIATCLSEEKCN